MQCCSATDDDDFPTARKSSAKESLQRVIERNESEHLSRRRNSRIRSLSIQNEIELAIETHRAHQEEFDLCIQVLGEMEPAVFHEIRSMRKPPQSVVNIIAVGAIILGETDVDWKALQRFLLK